MPFVGKVAWTPGGHGLIFSSSGFFGISRLQRLALTSTFEPAMSPELTVFGENATAVTVSKTGRLVYSAQSRDANIWRISLAGADRLTPVPLVSETFDDLTPDYSPDGQRLAFSSTRWAMRKSGLPVGWFQACADDINARSGLCRTAVVAGRHKILFYSSSPEIFPRCICCTRMTAEFSASRTIAPRTVRQLGRATVADLLPIR